MNRQDYKERHGEILQTSSLRFLCGLCAFAVNLSFFSPHRCFHYIRRLASALPSIRSRSPHDRRQKLVLTTPLVK